LSDALTGTFRGGASFIASDGTAYLLAGTSTNLQSLSANTWSNLLTGLTVTGRWRFEQFGDFVVAVNGGATQEVDLIAGTASALSGAPTGTSIAVVGDFVVIGQAGGDQLKVQWSAFNDHTAWTPAVDQSGFQPMLTGGEVKGIVGGEYGVILQRSRLVRMTRTGDAAAPFQFDEITNNYGCASAASIAASGRTIFFLSDRGFMALEDGQAIRPIGNEKVDRTFRLNVVRDDYERMFAAVDPENTLVYWGIPGTPGTIWIYNWQLDAWSTARLSLDGLFSGFSASVNSDSTGISDIDGSTFSVDDPRFSGGAPRFYCVQSGKAGALAGTPLQTTFQLGFTQYAAGRTTRLTAVRPIGDVVSGMTLTADARQRLGDDERLFTTSTLNNSGRMPLRCNGRYIKLKLAINAGVTWSYIQGFEIEFQPGGER
ncbi:hypothetical protein, partial [Novosphingobium sp.]|uniref:hypothetical protein n=1 Tax=Novosphingobium sp. TaxID=1874826 RepID=UPI00356802E7